MGLRRVLLGAQALPFCPSPSPLRPHTAFLKARCTLDSLWTPTFARFFSVGHAESYLSESASEAEQQEQHKAAERAKKFAKTKRAVDRRRQRFASDAEYLWNYREKQRGRKRAHVQQAKLQEVAKQRAQRRKTDHAYALYTAVPVWIRRVMWVRESVPWKTHIPVYYDEKVMHECAKCFVTRCE